MVKQGCVHIVLICIESSLLEAFDSCDACVFLAEPSVAHVLAACCCIQLLLYLNLEKKNEPLEEKRLCFGSISSRLKCSFLFPHLCHVEFVQA